MIKNIFFDRDGTLGILRDVRFPQTLELFGDARGTIKDLKAKGYKVFIVTNQACIAKGTDGGYDFAQEFRALGADDWFICPHEDKDNCNCRKPKTGLLDRAVQKYALNRGECVVVGDRESDILCAKRAGMKGFFLGDADAAMRMSVKPDGVMRTLSDIFPLLDRA